MFPIPVKLSQKAHLKRILAWQSSKKDKEFPSSWVYVRCGKCSNCLKQKRNEWLVRLVYHLRFQEQPSYFVTLTYDDEHVHPDGVNKKDCQDFFKRLRHTCSVPFSYFLVSEYGEKTSRPHYHFILFNYSADPAKIEDAWQNGNIFVGDVTDASINYCAKYFITKQVQPQGMNDNFSLISKGIGKDVVVTPGLRKFVQDNGYIHNGSYKVSPPRYWSDKWKIDSFRLPYHELGKLPEFDNEVDYLNFVATERDKSTKLVKRKTNVI